MKGMSKRCRPYGIRSSLHRTAVHTKCQIIYKYWTSYVDVVQQQVYQMGRKVVEWCKGTMVCEVGGGVLTGIIGCILYLVCYMER
jgi:hypothetical protein